MQRPLCRPVRCGDIRNAFSAASHNWAVFLLLSLFLGEGKGESVRSLPMALKSFWLALVLAGGSALLGGVTISGSPCHAQEPNPVTPDTEQQLTEQSLIERGNTLLEAGDFASARLLYQAAATQGSGKAAMLTGVTFDPRYQSMAGVSGPRSNAKLARQWYALAIERGDEQARRNDIELVEWLEEAGVDPQEEASAEDRMAASLDKPAAAPVARPEPQPAEKTPALVEPVVPQPQTVVVKSEPEPEPSTETIDQPVSPEAPEADAGPSIRASKGPSVFDARIVRAQLTSLVKEREPVDRLASPIIVSDGRIDRIVFFSEVRDLAGQAVSHRWEREGQTMADISFSIGGNTWRMHSSKRITPAMTGAWRVVVIDNNGGAELASVPFTLK